MTDKNTDEREKIADTEADRFEAEARRDTQQAIEIGKQQRAMFDSIFGRGK